MSTAPPRLPTPSRPPLSTLLVVSVMAVAVVSGSALQEPRFSARTDVVLVNVSVTDPKGRPVADLAQDDFQVYEDGLPQRIVSFARHAPNAGATTADAATAADLPAGTASVATQGASRSTSSVQGPAVLALAFDRLSPEGRALATRAAQGFVARKQPDELIGVFIVDQALTVLTPYTTNVDSLEVAVKRAAETATSQLARAERNPVLETYYTAAETPVVAGAEERGRDALQRPWVEPVARAGSDAPMIEMLLRMERSYQDMVYEMQGQASMNALLSLVDSLGVVPGGKAVVYFCEGLTIPPSAQPKFRAIIDTANRSNVPVYTVDTAGLRVQSKQAETARAVQELGATGVGDVRRNDKYLEAMENNASVTTAPVEVPASGPVVVGDVFVVGRAERVPPNDAELVRHPLNAAGVLIQPSLGDPISKAKQPELAFAVSMVIDPAAPAPTATLQLLQKGQSVAQIPLPLDKPGADGRLLQVSRLPSAAIPAGTYDLAITVTSGASRATRSTSVTLVD
jgi:VWFA-related protein